MPPTAAPLLETLWRRFGFTPNANQREAILYTDGPLFLPAGPGSGKTRVLLWRVVNLVAAQGIDPRAIFLATFTDKAAIQLREGLRAYLAAASEHTRVPYDIARMYVGTVHSLCQRMLIERDFQPNRRRGRAPALLDALDQYLLVNQSRNWQALLDSGGYEPGDAHARIVAYFGDRGSSKHTASSNCIALFNRFSEECLAPEDIDATGDADLERMVAMYSQYCALLAANATRLTDFSLLQQEALGILAANPAATKIFRHVIVDEYQDTNTVQERIFFRLASGHKNICVVGDDDQALYRFRGATVENFVQFSDRCRRELSVSPREIPLDTNYRSREHIVDVFGEFINQCDWTRSGNAGGAYRVESKRIAAHREDKQKAVVASTASDPERVSAEIAELVQSLLSSGRVADPNQIAFLYPSFKSDQPKRMIKALEAVGLRVFAPRAGSFLETPEATAMLGIFTAILGRPESGGYAGDYANYYRWLDAAEAKGQQLIAADPLLATFVRDRRAEVARARADYDKLTAFAEHKKWDLKSPYNPAKQKRALVDVTGLSTEGARRILGARFNAVVDRRIRDGNPLQLNYILKRATSLDWSLLDLFYQLTVFEHFGQMFDAAQRRANPDEGPVCNLALLTGYLSRFMEQRAPTIAGDLLFDNRLRRMLFGSYLYALHRRGESEYEDADDPFPKGRIPFLTIHQAKGLEFPVVVLGNPRKAARLQAIEKIVHPLLGPEAGREPLDRMAEFDTMRMFYVALSRAKNLLVIANFKSRGNFINDEFKSVVAKLPAIPDLTVSTVPTADAESSETPKIYSYTGDFMAYQRCPRQYLMFRKFAFVPSRSQTMVFGSLVHRTLDDLHQHIIGARSVL